MKKLSVIALEKHTVTNLKEDLCTFFGDIIKIEWHYIENSSFGYKINADLILYTSPNYYYMTRYLVDSSSKVIIMKRTISKEGYNKLLNIKNVKKAMIVNRTLEMAVETISDLRELGINHIDMIPVYPSMDSIPNLDIAITPDHVASVPKCAKKIINIGNRKLDISTIMDIAAKLNIDTNLIEEKLHNYIDSIIPISNGLDNIIKVKNELDKALDVIVKINDKAVIIIDKDKKILKKNELADRIFELYDLNTINEELYQILGSTQVLNTGQAKKDFIITYEGKNIIVNSYPFVYNCVLQGTIAICEEYNDFERKHINMKKKLMEKGHIAKYTFNDIIYKSSIMKSLESRCKKISQNNYPILIIGESGTGKEMFAQAIHNNSTRRNGPFLAINCSNLNNNLLDSELFGYEDGAFTGALRGGSKGLFEVAYGGTMFLDEIAEMPFSTQAKLLRVLEESQIRQVGGNKLLNVDVRIIAATNKNLRNLVDKNLFRNDLYYRLCTFEIHIPPLRERKDDIRILIDKFSIDNLYFKKLSEDVLMILEKYNWPGNVRQLRNAVRYMVQISEDTIKYSDLPAEIYEWYKSKSIECSFLDDYNRNLIELISGDTNMITILSCLIQAYENKETIGRRSLAKKMDNLNIFISENEIRTMLLKLEKLNLVNIKKGRSGTKLTKEGFEILKGCNGIIG